MVVRRVKVGRCYADTPKYLQNPDLYDCGISGRWKLKKSVAKRRRSKKPGERLRSKKSHKVKYTFDSEKSVYVQSRPKKEKKPPPPQPPQDEATELDTELFRLLRRPRFSQYHVSRLINRGANINLSIDGTIPLHEALNSGKIDRIRLLLKNGADPNSITGGRISFSYLRLRPVLYNPDCLKVLRLFYKYGFNPSKFNITDYDVMSHPLFMFGPYYADVQSYLLKREDVKKDNELLYNYYRYTFNLLLSNRSKNISDKELISTLRFLPHLGVDFDENFSLMLGEYLYINLEHDSEKIMKRFKYIVAILDLNIRKYSQFLFFLAMAGGPVEFLTDFLKIDGVNILVKNSHGQSLFDVASKEAKVVLLKRKKILENKKFNRTMSLHGRRGGVRLPLAVSRLISEY